MIVRAKELLEELSDADITARAKEIAEANATVTKRNAVPKPDEVDLQQMSLFDTVKDDDIIKELGELELGNMTPIDALNTLYLSLIHISMCIRDSHSGLHRRRLQLNDRRTVRPFGSLLGGSLLFKRRFRQFRAGCLSESNQRCGILRI